MTCDGCCNGRSECKGWCYNLWRSVESVEDSTGANSWIEERKSKKDSLFKNPKSLFMSPTRLWVVSL